jgi:hypothetical protein
MAGQKPKSTHKPNAAKKRHREKYRLQQRREKNKLKRIAQSNGRKYAERYAADHLLLTWAKSRGIV